ncbi:MAG: CHRD domain-containing protein [bacterium]|nr:CHRD domain-containing protein [bacterium]
MYSRFLHTAGILVLVAIGSLALSAQPALSDIVFEATLDGASNVPPIPAVSATGEAVMVLNNAQTELSYTITFTVLSSKELAAHFHNGGPRQIGPILEGLPLGSPKGGIWEVTPSDVVELLAGRVYINIHSEMYTGGEIRGNVVKAVVPIHDTTWGRVKSLYRAEAR